MDLDQLEYVVRVATLRHFTRAAEDICVAQSSLSQQIGKLEKELGIKLFDRTTRNVRLTSAGVDFIHHAKKKLAEAEAARQSMYAHLGLNKGAVKIGAITTLESIKFVSLITRFHSMYPGLNLHISQNGSHNLTEMLRTSEIDVAILTPPANAHNADITYNMLAEDEFVLVTSPTHRLANRQEIQLEAVSSENFVFPSPDQSIYAIYYQACLEAGFTPKIVCQCSHSETSLALVSQGMGVGLFPLDSLASETTYKYSYSHLAQPVKKRIALALSTNVCHPPAVQAFITFVLKHTNTM